jgi:Type II secretion system (T2SS), protein G
MRTMQLQLREDADGRMMEWLLLGMSVEEVLLSAGYWLVRGARLGLSVFYALVGNPVRLAFATGAVVAVLLSMGARDGGAYERLTSANLDEASIVKGATFYRADAGRWPDRLEPLVPKYLKEVRADPWGRKFVVHQGPGGFAIVSAGPDGEIGTNDDVVTFGPARSCGTRASSIPCISRPSVTANQALGDPHWVFVSGGAQLTRIGPGVLAAAGLQKNDIVVKMNGRPVASVQALVEAYPALRDADPLDLDILREDQPIRMVIGRDYIESQLLRE